MTRRDRVNVRRSVLPQEKERLKKDLNLSDWTHSPLVSPCSVIESMNLEAESSNFVDLMYVRVYSNGVILRIDGSKLSYKARWRNT